MNKLLPTSWMTSEIITKGPIPTISIILIEVACNRLISRFMKWLSLYELANARNQLVEVLRRCIDIGSDAHARHIFPDNAHRMDFVIVKQILLQIGRFLPFDADIADRAAELGFQGGVQLYPRQVLDGRHPVILQVKQSLLLPFGANHVVKSDRFSDGLLDKKRPRPQVLELADIRRSRIPRRKERVQAG